MDLRCQAEKRVHCERKHAKHHFLVPPNPQIPEAKLILEPSKGTPHRRTLPVPDALRWRKPGSTPRPVFLIPRRFSVSPGMGIRDRNLPQFFRMRTNLFRIIGTVHQSIQNREARSVVILDKGMAT